MIVLGIFERAFQSVSLISYGCDKGLYNWSYGTFLKSNSDEYHQEISRRRIDWGSYNRKVFFSFSDLEKETLKNAKRIKKTSLLCAK